MFHNTYYKGGVRYEPHILRPMRGKCRNEGRRNMDFSYLHSLWEGKQSYRKGNAPGKKTTRSIEIIKRRNHDRQARRH